MMIDDDGYISRVTSSTNKGKLGRGPVYRNWWLVKHNKDHNTGSIIIGNLSIPEKYVGKRVRFKIEVIED